MLIHPVSWNVVAPGRNKSSKAIPALQLFGYDINRESVYVKIDLSSTIVAMYPQEVSDIVMAYLKEKYSPIAIRRSEAIPRVVIMYMQHSDKVVSEPQWIKSRINPDGEFLSFVERRDISPYDWIHISNPYPVKAERKRSTSKNEYMAYENSVRRAVPSDFTTTNININGGSGKIQPRVLFFDIECYSPTGQVDARRASDVIFMVSVIAIIKDTVRGYLLHLGNVDEARMRESMAKSGLDVNEIPVTVMKYPQELDLIKGFYTLWITIRPDYYVSYNGDVFDIPYFMSRAALHHYTVPPLGKIKGVGGRSIISVMTPFGKVYKSAHLNPGVDSIDLLLFFREYYPGFAGYSLEKITKHLLGEGKSGLHYLEMFRIFEGGDPFMMGDVAWYSYKDTFLLYKLWTKFGIAGILYTMCNSTGCDINTMLRKSTKSKIECIYNIMEPALSLIDINEVPNLSMNVARKGIFRNIVKCEYGEFIVNNLSSPIYKRLKYLPAKMVNESIQVNITNSNTLDEYDALLDMIRATPGVVAVNNNHVWLQPGVSIPGITPMYTASLIFYFTPNSYVEISDGKITRHGTAAAVRIDFDYMETVQNRYFSWLATARDSDMLDSNLMLGDLNTTPIDTLVRSIRVKNYETYLDSSKPQAIIARLVAERGVYIVDTYDASYLQVATPVRYLLVLAGDEVDNVQADRDAYRCQLMNMLTGFEKIRRPFSVPISVNYPYYQSSVYLSPSSSYPSSNIGNYTCPGIPLGNPLDEMYILPNNPSTNISGSSIDQKGEFILGEYVELPSASVVANIEKPSSSEIIEMGFKEYEFNISISNSPPIIVDDRDIHYGAISNNDTESAV